MKIIVLLAGLLITAICQAVSFEYQTECVGSYTLKLPDNLEVALCPTATYLLPKSKYPVYFKDGKWAYLSAFNYNNNNLAITNYWNDEELDLVKKKRYDSNHNVITNNPDNVIELWNKANGFGYYADKASRVTIIIRNRVYSFNTSSYYQDKEQNFEFYKHNAEAIIAGFTTRKRFEVPQAAGKCIPYGFIAGDNRDIPVDLSVSFRLNEHPDVVITFTENTRSFSNALKFDAKEEMRNFWNYGYDYGNENITGIKLLGFPKNRRITMDGRSGVAGFVEIRYQDKSPADYGYYAVVDYYSRNGKSVKNHPWLQLSVIGKAS